MKKNGKTTREIMISVENDIKWMKLWMSGLTVLVLGLYGVNL